MQSYIYIADLDFALTDVFPRNNSQVIDLNLNLWNLSCRHYYFLRILLWKNIAYILYLDVSLPKLVASKFLVALIQYFKS